MRICKEQACAGRIYDEAATSATCAARAAAACGCRIGRGGAGRRRARRHRHPRARVHLRRPRSRHAAARRRRRSAPSGEQGAAADGERRGERVRRARARQHRGRLGRAVRAVRRDLSTAGAHAVRRRRAIGVRLRELGVRSVLLPGDRRVYLDTAFFAELARLGGPGDFAAAYVIGHEVGHHVQNLLGTADQVRAAQQRGSEAAANRLQVAMELQADCFAGVWAYHANRAHTACSSPATSRKGSAPPQAIGDDALQRNAGRSVTPDSFTHGSSRGSAALASDWACQRRSVRVQHLQLVAPELQPCSITASSTAGPFATEFSDGVAARVHARRGQARARPARVDQHRRAQGSRRLRARPGERREEGRHPLRGPDLAEHADAGGVQGAARRDERRSRRARRDPAAAGARSTFTAARSRRRSIRSRTSRA